MSECEKCAELRRQFSEMEITLRQRIAELEAHGKVINLPDHIVLGITAHQCILLNLLCNRAIATREAIMEAIHARSTRALKSGPKIIDVMVCHLRDRFCDRHGIEIVVHWGVGYSISADDKTKIRALIEAGQQGRKRAA